MLTRKEFIKKGKIVSIQSPKDTKEYIKIIKKLLELGYHTYDKTEPERFTKINYIVVFPDSPGGDIHPRIEPEGEIVDISYILGEGWNKSENKEWWKSLKEGDYIVFNYTNKTSESFKYNFIYKVIKLYSNSGYRRIFNSDGVTVVQDSTGVSNGWAVSLFRKATSEEIKLYEHAGKPVDVTTYKIPEETKSKEFVLPEKWCIRVTDISIKDINKWRNHSCSLGGYVRNKILHNGLYEWVSKKPSDYTEITFEQFKEYVLGEKGGDMKETTNKALLEEAKRKYPVGTKFRCLVTNNVYEIPSGVIFKRGTNGYDNIYSYTEHGVFHKHYDNSGKWAEIISSPKEKSIEKWSVGSYVVAIRDGAYGYSQNRDSITKGTVAKITHEWGDKDSTIGIELISIVIQKEIFKWFPTKEEAEAFAKTLLEPKQPKFVVGKWYKCRGCYEYIIRFKEIKNNNFITDTGYISNGKYVNDTSNGSIISIDREFIEVPLEEIQQYLPEGHVDKLVKEKKNVKSNYVNVRTQEQWDFVTKKLGCSWRSSTWENSKFCICLDGTCYSSSMQYDSEDYITFEQWLEDTGYTYPENKFNYKFKVGDKVKVICSGSGCAPKEVNKEVKITERGDYAGDPGYKVSPAIGNTADGEFGGFIGEKSFELITSKEETYEVGDWIILTQDYGEVKKGTVHKIDSKSNPNLYSYVSISDSVGYGCLPFKNMLRKATPEEIAKAKQTKYYNPVKPKLEWKVGAYVRYKGTKKHDELWEEYFGTKGVVKGDVGIINSISSNWFFIKDNIRPDESGILLKEDLELITKEEYERGLRRDTAPWKVPTLADLPYTPKESYKKTDKVEVQLIDVPRI